LAQAGGARGAATRRGARAPKIGPGPAAPGAPRRGAMYGTGKGQLSRDERVQLHGIDCDDQIVWREWTPGIESVQDLVLRNVALVTQKLRFALPPTKEFDMPYPEPFKLAPGMKKSIPISFRPSKYEPHVDQVEIMTKGGSFFVQVKAVVKDIAVTVPHFVDFGLCPTSEKSEVLIDVYNTGTLKAALRWHARPPFSVKCAVDSIDVGMTVRCVVGFEPKTASVFDAKVMCEASRPLDEATVDEDAVIGGGGWKAPPGTKRYPMQATGVGKVPHLCVPQPLKPEVEFGRVFPGNRVPQTLQILNMTPVRATFRVRALHDSGEVSPLPPTPFAVSPDSGIVEPESTYTLTFYFQSHTVKEFACQRFQISTPGGTPLVVTCKAFCRPMEVRLSMSSINFGEVACGKQYSRTLQLHNGSDRPALYHFVNADNMRGVFWFDRYMGVIPPQSFMVVTVFFGPLAPINYYKHVFCAVKGAAAPLALDLLGSAHTEKTRPAFLEQRHIDYFKNMQQNGIREFPPPPEKEDTDGLGDDDSQQEEDRTFVAFTRAPSATSMFLEMTLPLDSKLRDVTVSPADLDFGSCSTLTMSDKQLVTLTNRSSQKVSVAWMIPGETRLPCTPDEKALFAVYPPTCDIKPRASADFQVSIRPQNESNYEGEILEAIVYQKVNRNFRLVDLNRFTPPLMVSIRGIGHTMGSTRNDPRLDISERNMRFRAAYPGERTYQVAMFTNPGDTCISYRILPPIDAAIGDTGSGTFNDLKEEVPFNAWPTQGIISPHKFHLIVLEFAPMVGRNERAFVANFPIVVDYNESHPLTLHVAGRAWEPKLAVCGGQPTVTFPPTCSGIPSNFVCGIKNVSEIPISYECRIPSRFRSMFWFPNATGQLSPSESGSVTAHFCPTSESVFSAPMYVVAKAIENPDNAVEGPLEALMSPSVGVNSADPTYVLQFVGHGKGPAISLDPDYVDLGPVQACREVTRQVTILNSSSLTVHYSIAFELVEHENSPKLGGAVENSLELGSTEGSIAGRCTETLDITFTPPCRGFYEYRIAVTPWSDQGGTGDVSGRAIALTLTADVQYPFVQIADLRTESATLQPQSMMWTQFQVDGINDLYRGQVADSERAFQGAIGIDQKKQLVKQLRPFQLLFGTAAAGSEPTVVYLVLSNPGFLRLRFSFQTPKNLNLENAPYWCDEKAMVDDREAHFAWVEEHGIYEIQPRSGEIAAGDFLYVKMTYNHHSIGTHILPIVFNVHDGRSVLLYLKAHSVAPNVGCLSVRSSVVPLQPVPLNVREGPMQPVELTNSGGVAAHWRIDKQSMFEFNMSSYDFEILKVAPSEGVLEAQSSTYIQFTFTPLEAKSYACPVRIEMLKDGRPAEELCFELRAEGYDPNKDKALAEPYFPPNLPIQMYAPVPGCGAALSIEILDFDRCPLRSKVSRMLVLVNYSADFVLSYRWEPRQLFRSEGDLVIEPNSGELSPGSHCIVVFRLCCARPVDVSGEVACFLEWTHMSDYSQRGFQDTREEDSGPRVEYLAYHSQHIHEPIRTGKAFIAQAEAKHVSVANRLTVSKFRNLMSTAAGQKFLNENLHRTALLASHIQTAPSPRKQTQTSTMSRGTISAGVSIVDPPKAQGAAHAPPPTSYPLYVRLRAVVADWEVPKEDRVSFLISGAPNAEADVAEDEEDHAEQLRTRAAIKGTQLRGVSEPSGKLNADLVRGVMEHMIREVLAEDEFGEIVDKMLVQDTPYFLQYEDSPPPGDPDRPTEQLDEEMVLVEDMSDAGADATIALLKDRPEPTWATDVLMDIPAPRLAVPSAASASGSNVGRAIGSTALELDATGAFDDSAAVGAADEYGDVDLESFKDSAGQVLDQMLLDMMDDVIGGRLNWMRPIPRVRPWR